MVLSDLPQGENQGRFCGEGMFNIFSRRYRTSVLRFGVLTFLSFILVIMFFCSAYSGTGAEEVMSRLQSTYSNVKDVTMQFSQTSAIQGFEEKVFSGTLYVKKPELMRWDYLKPVKQSVFVGDKKMILYMPEQKQAIVQNISDHPDAEPAMGLLSNIDRWKEIFTFKAEGETPESYRIELRPKTMFFVEKVTVDINRKSSYITSLILFEKSGSKVSFVFSGIETNKGLKDSLFNFKAPKGTEVLEY